jgi:hypothetical protein
MGIWSTSPLATIKSAGMSARRPSQLREASSKRGICLGAGRGPVSLRWAAFKAPPLFGCCKLGHLLVLLFVPELARHLYLPLDDDRSKKLLPQREVHDM